jgi:hypothetical protein
MPSSGRDAPTCGLCTCTSSIWPTFASGSPRRSPAANTGTTRRSITATPARLEITRRPMLSMPEAGGGTERSPSRVHGSENGGDIVGNGECRIEAAQPRRLRDAVVVGVCDDRRSGRHGCRCADVAAAGEPNGPMTNPDEPWQAVEFSQGISCFGVRLIDDDHGKGRRVRRERRANRVRNGRSPVAGADDHRDVW